MLKKIPDLNTAEHWDGLWRDLPNYYRSPVRDPVVKAILARLTPRQRILDVGGGQSRFSHLARQLGHEPFVVDISPWAIEALAQRGIPGAVCDVQQWDGELFGDFDLAVCTEVLEHLVEPEAALRLIAAHMDWAFFSVPNRTSKRDFLAEHVGEFTLSQFRRLLEQHFRRIGARPLHQYLYAEAWGKLE